jgi:DNA replication protein DnaC
MPPASGCARSIPAMPPSGSATLGEAVRAEIAPHAFLEQLLAAELSGREERRVKMSLKVSNLPLAQTLDNFDFAFQPAIERSRIDTLATCAWYAMPRPCCCRGRRAWASRIRASPSA